MKTESLSSKGRGWSWIPTLYFAEGLPYVLVMVVSVIMYKKLNISNAEISLYTSLLYLPWVIKPLWSPVVDIFKTKRGWVLSTQLLISLGLAAVAFSLPMPGFFYISFFLFSVMAFLSATHDIAADGFYMLALNEHDQSFYVGARSLFYRLAMIAAQGLLVILAGFFEEYFKSVSAPDMYERYAWMLTFFAAAFIFILLFLYHKFFLPKPAADCPASEYVQKNFTKEFLEAFRTFFKRKNIAASIAFLLLYRLGESQLVKIASPFLLDAREKGGLGLSTGDVGFAYGTIGIAALVAGGLLGGVAIARHGLKKWLWWMLAAINVPHLLYVYLSVYQPVSFTAITTCVAIEQFGYGFGFAAYLMYMIYISGGEYKTSHYAICTGFMALGMMLPGMLSGIIQEAAGYKMFFIYICISVVPPLIASFFLKIDPEFGKKEL